MEIEFLMKVTFLEQLIHFSEHYRALRLHQLKTAGGSLFLAVGKSETAHHARGPTPIGGGFPLLRWVSAGGGRRPPPTVHLSLIVSPKTAIWGEKLRNLPLVYAS